MKEKRINNIKNHYYAFGLQMSGLAYSEMYSDRINAYIYGVSAVVSAGISCPISIAANNTWSALLGSLWELF